MPDKIKLRGPLCFLRETPCNSLSSYTEFHRGDTEIHRGVKNRVDPF